jgi:hypothetical protein
MERDKYTTSVDIQTGSLIPATYNPCTPLLSAPQKILALDPLWSSCLRAVAAIHDPDIQLTPGPGFGPVTIHTPIPTLVYTGGAVAGQSVSQVLPASTIPPNHSTARPTNAVILPAFSQISPVVIFGTATVTANSDSEFIVGTQTVRPGDQVVVGGTTVDYASNGRYMEIGGTTQFINPSFVVGTQTLSAGAPGVVIEGKTYSVEAGGSSVVIDGTTEAVSQATEAPNSAQKVWMTIPAYIIDGQTLMAGGLPITFSGTVMSLDSDGESVVIVVSKTMDINDVLESTPSPDAFDQIGLGVNSTSVEGIDSEIISSSSAGMPSPEPSVVGTKSRSGARRKVNGGTKSKNIWLGLLGGIAVVLAEL